MAIILSANKKPQLVLGLTGSFGSGCSTLRDSLVQLGFKDFRLSKYVKNKYHEKTGKPPEEAPRSELQDTGDDMRRESKNNGYLAELAAEEAKNVGDDQRLVFANIRTLGEVQFFRSKYSRFFLIAVDCSPKKRWERVREREYFEKHLPDIQFEIDDKRDKYDEKTEFGQSVDFCVDEADVVIDNEENLPTEDVQIDKLKETIIPYINLLEGDLSRTPNPLEMYMGIAYTASLQSQCVKRRVGAVIVDEKYNAILSVGYNENPYPIEPCLSKYHRCYRDIYKVQYFKHLEKLKTICPDCHKEIKNIKPPFLCECGCDLDEKLVHDKAMNRCTALHAEEKALLNIGSRNVSGCTLYTTTFPCFTCAQKIVYSKISSVVYVEPYPDQDAVDFLDEGGVSIRKFEGIKAKAYFRVFGSWQREIEKTLYKQ